MSLKQLADLRYETDAKFENMSVQENPWSS